MRFIQREVKVFGVQKYIKYHTNCGIKSVLFKKENKSGGSKLIKKYFLLLQSDNRKKADGELFRHFQNLETNKTIYTMKALIDRILKDGKCYEGGILKVDKFINHQMDPNLMKQVAVELIRRYASTDINKILTVEASGIAPAIMMGFLLDLPVVFAKKKKPSTMSGMLSTTIFSFTKQREYTVCISKDYLTPNDKVLFVDDFLAYGNAAKGIIDLCQQAGAELVGMGFIIEKAFQHGRDAIEEAGIRCESLAIIDSLNDCRIKIRM